jgi:hypothetical protein
MQSANMQYHGKHAVGKHAVDKHAVGKHAEDKHTVMQTCRDKSRKPAVDKHPVGKLATPALPMDEALPAGSPRPARVRSYVTGNRQHHRSSRKAWQEAVQRTRQ